MAIAPRTALALVLLLSGCAATPPAPAPVHAIAPAMAVDGDWRSVPILPFGSRLAELQAATHEVLLFGAQANLECYALEAPARRFVGRPVQSYMLCFAQGRLVRVELSVNLAAADAAADFSRYCEQWQSGTDQVPARTAGRCGGTAPQGTSFSASLGDGQGEGEAGVVPLSLIVSDTPVPESP